jgi:hypothetical protein
MACASVSLCVALASTYRGSGRVMFSKRPRGGPRTWRVERVRAARNPDAVTCPSSTECVGGEFDGNIVTSTDPTGAPSAWHVAHVDNVKDVTGMSAVVDGVSCPSVSRCVAVDDAGNVFSSIDPTGGASGWTRDRVATAALGGDSAVSCPSVSLCVADVEGRIFTSTDPWAGPPTWASAKVSAPSVDPTISCPSASWCVVGGGDLGGDVLLSVAPTTGRSGWHRERVDGTNTIDAVACLSARFCLAADSDSNVLTGTPLGIRIAVPSLIARREPFSLTVRRDGTRLGVDTELMIGCPDGAAACSVTGKATYIRVPDGLTPIGQLALTIRPGHRQEIVFVLSRSGARLLVKKHGLTDTDLGIVARLHGGLAVADELFVDLNPPGAVAPFDAPPYARRGRSAALPEAGAAPW